MLLPFSADAAAATDAATLLLQFKSLGKSLLLTLFVLAEERRAERNRSPFRCILFNYTSRSADICAGFYDDNEYIKLHTFYSFGNVPLYFPFISFATCAANSLTLHLMCDGTRSCHRTLITARCALQKQKKHCCSLALLFLLAFRERPRSWFGYEAHTHRFHRLGAAENYQKLIAQSTQFGVFRRFLSADKIKSEM